MKTIGVKLDEDRARRFASEAESRGLTVSGAVAALLAQLTQDFTDFSVLDELRPVKRGRPPLLGAAAASQLDELLAKNWTLRELCDRVDGGDGLDDLPMKAPRTGRRKPRQQPQEKD